MAKKRKEEIERKPIRFDYQRVRQTFTHQNPTYSNQTKRNLVSEDIDSFLDLYGMDLWEVVFYNEVMIDEGTIHVTVLFKKTIYDE
jgi:hypothetical protein